VNPEFTIDFAGKTYSVRKANLEKAVLYQKKVKELRDDPSADAKIIAYCLWLVLKDVDPSLDEARVMSNVPADIDPLDLLITLGFINPQKVGIAKRLQNKMLEGSITENSSGL
jgi:hypothetical protein